MAAAAQPVGVVGVEDLGSHFVVRAPARPALTADRAGLRTAALLDGGTVWALPAIPDAVTDLRRLLDSRPAFSVAPPAQRLMRRLEALPATAGAVAHRCEHRPGRPGVVIALLPDPVAREALSTLPGARHDPRYDRWWIPAEDESLAALCELLHGVGWLAATDEVRRLVEDVVQPTLSLSAVAGLEHRCSSAVVARPDGQVEVQLCRRCVPELPERVGADAQMRGSLQAWWLTVDEQAGALVERLLADRPRLDGGNAGLVAAVRGAAADARLAGELERLSASADGPTTVAGLDGALRPFQGAAVEYALRVRRTFLADEPGLGKTVQALAALEASGSFPALVVCPASLRLNWLSECRRWLPGRTVSTVDPRAGLPDADVAVVSYSALHEVAAACPDRGLRGLVLDESHLCKNGSARRTQAAVAIADALPGDAMVLLLTGTPVVNRPHELAAQLRVLGRLDAAGDTRALERMRSGGTDPQALNRRLRRTCFVRRRKEAVLSQLPAKQRVVVPMAITNREEYARVHADVARWIRAEAEATARFADELAQLPEDERQAAIAARGRAAEQRARRADALVRVNKLALLAARGKLDAATEWIEGLLETDEKLVVFARHRAVSDALYERFPDAALATGRPAADRRDAEVHRFQEDPACRLIVCSIDAAGVGLTLTAASNVAFVEMAWTSAAHDQAEDRVHRIGQASAVTAWYLLADGTIDEQMVSVVERKRRLALGATDGAGDTESPALDAVLDWISRHAT